MAVYTQRAELVFRHAESVARSLRHREVYAIHILLGLAGGSDLAAKVLSDRGLFVDIVMQAIGSRAGCFFTFSASEQVPDNLPWSNFAQFASREAASEASKLGHNYVGTEHILLAMTKLSDQQWFGLASLAEIRSIRKEVLSLLGHAPEVRGELGREEILKKVIAIRDDVIQLAKDLET